MILTFEMEPPEDKVQALLEMLNHVNQNRWIGAFHFWQDHQLMVYQYGLLVAEEGASAEIVKSMIETAVSTAEQFYPAFQLVTWADNTPEQALQIAIAGAYGHA